MTRCQMVREFSGGEFSRCSAMVHNPDTDDFCYLCEKYAKGLTEPYVYGTDEDMENGRQVVRLMDISGKEYWRM